MCLEYKNQKAKNDWFNCTLKYSKHCTREIFIRGWNKTEIKKGKQRLMCFEVLKHQKRWTVDGFPS